jgi:aldehyde:ferredoxin oxidoreductase
MADGYMNKILRVNLSTAKMQIEPVPEDWKRNYIGGNGFAARILYDELKPGIDPLGPENKLIFMTGPLTGTICPTSGRYAVYAKSPLTGVWGEAHSGGHFGPEMKFSGFDGIVIEGRSEKPVYLFIDDGKPELRSAEDLWGRDTHETEEMIKEEIGDDEVRTAVIGPAGEKLVKIACIINDRHRAAGRCGLGAVIGSKNLKAVACRGNREIEVAEPEKMLEVLNPILERMAGDSVTGDTLPMEGTQALTDGMNDEGIYPVHNFRDSGTIPGYEKITGATMRDTILIKTLACAFCNIRCARYTVAHSPRWGAVMEEGPEYETVWAFGGQTGVTNLADIQMADLLCDKLGLDTISTGNLIGFAMECYEKGLITKKETDGLSLNFGNGETMVRMVERIANREGWLGDALAEGWKEAAKRIGKGAEYFTMQVRNLGLPAYDPRAVWGMALGYATSLRGGCHLRAYTNAVESTTIGHANGQDIFLKPGVLEDKPEWVIAFQNQYAALDSLILCKFTSFAIGPEDYAAMLRVVTGIDWTAESFLKAGERIWNLERCFNVREGERRKDDTLPQRFLKEPLPVGPPDRKGLTVPLDQLLDIYYNQRGWDVKKGIPTPEKLRELGLTEEANQVAKLL